MEFVERGKMKTAEGNGGISKRISMDKDVASGDFSWREVDARGTMTVETWGSGKNK